MRKMGFIVLVFISFYLIANPLPDDTDDNKDNEENGCSVTVF